MDQTENIAKYEMIPSAQEEIMCSKQRLWREEYRGVIAYSDDQFITLMFL